MLQIAKSLNELMEQVEQTLAHATQEILFSFPLHLISTTMLHKKPHGVVLQGVDTFSNISLYGYHHLKQFCSIQDQCHIRFFEPHETFQRFSLVDGKIVSFINPNNQSPCIGQTIRNEHLGKKYRADFFDFYSHALSLDDVLSEIEQTRMAFLQEAATELNQLEHASFKDYIDYGTLVPSSNTPNNFAGNKKIDHFLQKFNTNLIVNLQKIHSNARTYHDSKRTIEI